MAKLFDLSSNYQRQDVSKQKLEEQHQQQRELADAISRLAPLDDIRIMLASGAQVDTPVTQGLRPIHYAAYQNYVEAVKLLLVRGCEIDAMDENCYTAVHLAAERGYYELLEFLVEKRARINFTDLRKNSVNLSVPDEPLSLALKRNHLKCAELLLKNGADPNASYFMGFEINFLGVSRVDALRLLLKYGANPNKRDRSGLTPLMNVAKHPQGLPAVKLLVEYGADVNDITGERHDFRTVLHHSIFSGRIEIIQYLLAHGARYPSLDFDKPSPLDIAIISGRQDIVQLLIEYDADVNAGSNSTIGQPLQTALTQKIEHKYEIVELLLDNGANPNSANTSNRKTGPPIHDYLNSIRQCASGSLAASGERATICFGPDTRMLRLLLKYGGQIVLTTSDKHPSGIVRELMQIRDDLSLESLHLLIESAYLIDWTSIFRLIYHILRRESKRRPSELLDPSESAFCTPAQLIESLKGAEVCQRGLGKNLLDKIRLGEHQFTAPTLKQISRIELRRHLSENKKLVGRKLVSALKSLPIPLILRDYLLYER